MKPVNLVICGTPGTGKSTLVNKLKPKLQGHNFVNISKFAIENDCIEEYDESLDTQVIDEDKLIDKLGPELEKHGLNIIESIHGDMLPDDLVDRVYVCRAETEKLYDRLTERKYSQEKLTNNVEAEIFQTVYQEAVDKFGASRVIGIDSNVESDIDENARIVLEYLAKFVAG